MQKQDDIIVEDNVTLLDYLLPLVRHRRLIFFGTALFGLLGVLYAFTRAPYYTATAYFVPRGALGESDELRALAGETGKNWQAVRSAGDVVKYYDVALKSRPLMEKLLEREFARPDGNPAPFAAILTEDGTEDVPAAELIRGLRENLEVASGGGKLLTLAYSAPRAELAADVVNAVIEEYERQPRRSQQASADVRFIRDRIAEVQTKIEERERQIAEAKSRSLDSGQPDAMLRLASLERDARLLEKLYESLNTEYAKAEIRMIQSQKDTTREIEVMDRAEPPLRKTGPKRLKLLVVFLFVGGVVTTGFAFVSEYFRNLSVEFRDHTFWHLLRRSRRDLLLMAAAALLALLLLLLYRALASS
jgi:uncharacterized protein involved in exopolysaccharide biosynthesis